jgi:alpha-tubulin suppressor-like RCC1 family protein
LIRLAPLLACVACFGPSFGDGQIPCGPAGECPTDLACAADRKCWHAGIGPAPCAAGYTRAGDGTCVDVDECATGAATCDAHATCANRPGSYSCACQPGWSGDGKTCVDVDECRAGTAMCDTNASCSNIPGSYTCACKPGWKGDGKTCAQSFDLIASAADHACAVRGDGALFCWGDNSVGQLGAGMAQASVRAPIRVGAALWKQIAVAGYYSCGLQTDGSLWCWGDDGCGTIGDGDTGNCRGTKAVPTPYPTGGATTRWLAVATGASHACAIQQDGSLWCWGRDAAGDLGTNDGADHLVPTRVGSDVGWDTVSAGGAHTCGLRAGALWCWGANDSGQLGDGGTVDSSPIPKRIGTGSAWRALAAGDLHSCGILSDQTLACWGAGTHGQLGDGMAGATAVVKAPTVVPGGALWAAVAAGDQETCARTATGGLFCFGAGSYGQLGDGGFTDRSTPATVAGSDWAAISVGGATACATKTSGQMWCWGRNDSGALGLGTGGDAATPRAIPGAGVFTQTSFGTLHACGIRADKTLWCWGDNSSGQLGLGVTGGARDAPTAVSGGGTWSAVAAGANSTCAVHVGGALYCWGGNLYGQLGVGTSGVDASMDLPTRVPDPGPAAATWSLVSARGSHACATQTDGSLWCWGYGGNGQLGIGPTSGNVPLPAAVGGTGWTAVAAGDAHTCAIQGGALRCWGQNDSGQCGTGPDPAPLPVPTAVGQDSDWTQIAAGSYHSCGLRGAALFCWGDNGLGQLGNGSSGANTDAVMPGPVAAGQSWAALDAGDYTTCAVATGGGLSCWGSNAGGLVGSGAAGTIVPSPVAIGTGFTAVGLAAQAGCALQASGQMSCWGDDADGIFGDDTVFYETPARVVDPG